GADRAAHGACVQAPERLGAPRTRPYTGGVSSLPTGTVTLLFTDIESSTRLVQELGDAYSQLLSDHRRLVRDAVAEAGGREVDCGADPGGADLRGLGEDERKRLPHPERIFRVGAAAPDASFPPWREAGLGGAATATLAVPAEPAPAVPAPEDGAGAPSL